MVYILEMLILSTLLCVICVPITFDTLWAFGINFTDYFNSVLFNPILLFGIALGLLFEFIPPSCQSCT